MKKYPACKELNPVTVNSMTIHIKQIRVLALVKMLNSQFYVSGLAKRKYLHK